MVFLLRIRILTSAEKAREQSRIPLTRDERVKLAEQEDADEDEQD